MQHDSDFSQANSTAHRVSTPAAKSKRSLPLRTMTDNVRPQGVRHTKTDALSPAASASPSSSAAAATPAASPPHAPDAEPSGAQSHVRTMSWLPFPAMNTNISWTDLADSDEEDLGWNAHPTGQAREAAPEASPLNNDGTMPVSGPLIPSFSGETVSDAPRVASSGVGDAQSDLSSLSLGRLESPTPVTVIQDLGGVAKQPSRTQFGFALGSTLPSKVLQGGVADAATADAAVAAAEAGTSLGSRGRWGDLHHTSRDIVPGTAEVLVEARLEAVSAVSRDERVARMVEDAKRGMAANCAPSTPREGMGGTYFLSSDTGRYVGIFKPCDEEPLAPNNPKGWNSRAMSDPGMKPSIRVGEAALREVAAFLLDHDGFAGVPPACLVAVSHQILNYSAQPSAAVKCSTAAPDAPPHSLSPGGEPRCADNSLHAAEHSLVSSASPVATPADSRLTAPAQPGGMKLGSLQAFAEHTCDANDIASSRFSADSIHRVGILDIRLLNLDRHAGNLLVAEAPRGGNSTGGPGPLHKLIPIDHGFALPEALDDPYFEWQYWPQASVPFSPEVKAYVEALDGPADVEMLQRELPALRPECLRCLLVTTTVLKRCVAANMTLSEIAGIFSRAKASEASDFEAICMDAREDALAYAALPAGPSLTLSDLPLLNRDHTTGHPSACLGPFTFDEASGELSPQSSLAMSGLLGNGNGVASGTLSCEASPFKSLREDVVSEIPLDYDAHVLESPCMIAAAAAAAAAGHCVDRGTPVLSGGLPALPSTPSWLCTADLGPYSPHSPTLIAPSSVCFQPFHSAGGKEEGPAGAVRRSEQGMSLGGFGAQLSARTTVAPRTVWHSKRRGRNGPNHPNLLSAVHPEKANYAFSGLSECQWATFLARVEDFVDEEIKKATWKVADCAGPVAGSCPEPVKSRRF